MARIRSIHPGLFTDEGFVSCSPLARLLILGLWTEADDQGVFEWKPVTLKMRLLPADGADVTALLSELAEHNICRRFEADGKAFGAIRNFRKYQRPKYPTAVHPLPDDIASYVAIPPKPAVEDDGIPRKGGKPPQMEDGGWREGEEIAKDASKPASLDAGQLEIFLKGAEFRCTDAAGSSSLGPFLPIAGLLREGVVSLDEAVTMIRARPAAAGGVLSWKFYAKVIRDESRSRPANGSGPAKVFVARTDPGWEAHCRAARHSPSLTTQHTETKAEGWYFPVSSLSSIERSA
ncbi:MAG: hypothetical protein J0J10_26330 [Bosea sp.]|uniref:hypothetical protein n=1 Tax=Bosea sp. (in: a-proteobacteria) TaxID=1871050 RepID=UPI001ACF893B|nr:hypothetical protein [Bosea sp. (in: a-proteobacteria)]MBN9472283.1 hypothetical protein [Bosea sp. (in: a-proteobacteria)]